MQLLLVEDNPADAALIREMLADLPGGKVNGVTETRRLDEARAFLQKETCCDLVLLDLGLPDSQGLETLNELLKARADVPVVVLTGLDDRETALAAIRDGAQDYLVKGMIDPQLLERTLYYARERHRLRSALEQSMARMRLAASVMASTLEGIFITDPDFRIAEINPAFTDITGLSLNDVKGESPATLGAGHYEEERYLEIRDTVKNGGFWQGEVWNRRRDGEVFAAWLNVNALRDEAGRDRGYVGIFTDITQRKLVEQHLKKMAHYDVLTGLPNRALFYDRLEQAITRTRRHQAGEAVHAADNSKSHPAATRQKPQSAANEAASSPAAAAGELATPNHGFPDENGSGQPNGTRVALLFLDLDKFKPINDTLGHEAGDQILQQLARRLQTCIRQTDTVARLGGDEFVIMLPDLAAFDDAIRVAEKALTAVTRPFKIKNEIWHLGTSIGIAIFPDHGQDRDTLLQQADAAMYRAKQAGGNTWRGAAA